MLKDYLGERELEVEGIMLTLFDQSRVWDMEKKNIMLEQIRKTVLKMFKRNMPLEDIADMNDISVEQVKKICKL